MIEYTEKDKDNDFSFFVKNYQLLFDKYGHKFLAIRNKEILGAFDSVIEAIEELSETYEPGNYIIQECTGDESAYKTTIMRLMIRG